MKTKHVNQNILRTGQMIAYKDAKKMALVEQMKCERFFECKPCSNKRNTYCIRVCDAVYGRKGKTPKLYACCKRNGLSDSATSAARNAATSKRKRKETIAAIASNTKLASMVRTSDERLRMIATVCLIRWLKEHVQHGSKSYLNIFQWSARDKAGFSATSAVLTDCERTESLSHLFMKNPPLWVGASTQEPQRKIKGTDIFGKGEGVHISPFLKS